MALRKAITLDSGVDVDYWRIVGLSANLLRGRVLVELLAWRSAQARNQGRQPIHDTHRTVELAVTGASDLRLSALYQQLVAQQVELEPARTFVDPTTGQPVTVAARTEPGFFFGAEDI